MTRRTTLSRTASRTALIAALAAGPAAAEITGPEVWEDWKSYMQSFGYEVEGDESQSGDDLTVTDVVMTIEFPEEDGNFVITLPSVTFTDNADGSVSVALPETMPMTFNATSVDGEDVTGTLSYAQTGSTMMVSGDPDDMTYTYEAQSVRLVLDRLEIDGEVTPPEDLRASGELTQVSSVTRMQLGEVRSYDQDMTAGALSYDVFFLVPEEDGGGTGSWSGSMDRLTITGVGALPLDGESDDMNAMLEAGLSASGGFSYEAGRSQIDMQPPDGPVVGTTSSDGGTIEVALGPDGLRYGGSQTNLAIDMQQMPELPFPISIQLATMAFNIAMPLQESEEPQDFAFGFTLGDFTISDAIWNLFDPAGQLPRDPATILVDLTGTARVLVNMMAPDAAMSMQTEAPGELQSLQIRNLLVAAVGARATGTGAFTFDNSDTVTFNGMPKPQGELDVRVEGANALIDKLVQMGMLPEEQAMGARMMMGLFGVSQGDDVLTSKIEVNEEGHVLANGQRLQ